MMMELPEIRVYSADGQSPVSVDLPPPSYSNGRSSVSSAGAVSGGSGAAGGGSHRSSAAFRKASSDCQSPQLCNVSVDEHTKRAGRVHTSVLRLYAVSILVGSNQWRRKESCARHILHFNTCHKTVGD